MASRWLLLSLFVVISHQIHPSPVATTKQGQLKGVRSKSRDGRNFLAFKGIPYAAPPIGDLRFKPPEPLAPWTGVRDASTDGKKCIQFDFIERNRPVGHEDCLYLNVYTHELGTKPLRPVLVWFHGGCWFRGHSGSGFYGPGYLLDEDVVLVTANYRVGPFGFLSTEDAESSGNYGMKDQVAALRWVRDNIEAFGGDPNSVTIFGQSAGGASTHLHLLSPLSAGLFHRAISQSGSAFCPWGMMKEPRRRAQLQAALVGCPTAPSKELVKCLRKKDAYDVINTFPGHFDWSTDPMCAYGPSVEVGGDQSEAFLSQDPSDIIKQGVMNHVPWMVGATKDEGIYRVAAIHLDSELTDDIENRFDAVAPFSFHFQDSSLDDATVARRIKAFYFNGSNPSHENTQDLIDAYTDRLFLVGVNRAVKLHAATAQAPIFYYQFSYEGRASYSTTYGPRNKIYGVCHGDDLLYLFNNSEMPQMAERDPEMKTSRVLIKLWTNFARTGNPTPEQTSLLPVEWPPVTPDDFVYLDIGETLRLGRNLHAERMEFWESLPLKENEHPVWRDEL